MWTPEQGRYYQEAASLGYSNPEDIPFDSFTDTPEKRRARAEATVSKLKAQGIGRGFDWQVNGQGNVVAPNTPSYQETISQIQEKGNPFANDPVNQSYFKRNANQLLNNHLNKITSSGTGSNLQYQKTLADGTQVFKTDDPNYLENRMRQGGSILAEHFNMQDGIVSPEFKEFLRTKGRRVG